MMQESTTTNINTENTEPEEEKSGIVGRIVTIIIVALCALICFVCLRFKVRYIATGSMLPSYQIGEIVLVDPESYKQKDPQAGDVAMYKYGEREVIHRVVSYSSSSKIPTCTFKGDNNEKDDFKPIPVTDIEGKVVWKTSIFAPLVRAIYHLENV